jgi:hypothetical protein
MMLSHSRALAGALAAIAIAAVCTPGAAAQAGAAAGWTAPRTPDGKPDLQGVWTNSSITTLERSDPSAPLVLTDEQARRLEASRAAVNAADAAPTDPSQGAPAAGGGVGGYNLFWIDRGSQVGVIRGEKRSSWIVDPSSGRMPVSDQGRARIRDIMIRRGEDGPEGMNPADRCLIGSRGSGGPPMLNNIYNNTYQIVQTPDHVMINVEMMHDARVIRMEQAHKPDALLQWLGDSVGRWEGDTLVVTTKGWNRQHGDYEPVYLSERATVTERFTRTGPDEILYAFTVDDPGFYTQAWSGEMVFTPSNGPVYEFACHEGNYALLHILQGARMADARAGR